MIADKIRILRDKKGITQAELAYKLGITRSAVNAWEMGITIPSTSYVIEIAKIFKVSTDYLLGVAPTATVSVEGLTDREISSVVEVIECYRKNKNKEE